MDLPPFNVGFDGAINCLQNSVMTSLFSEHNLAYKIIHLFSLDQKIVLFTLLSYPSLLCLSSFDHQTMFYTLNC